MRVKFVLILLVLSIIISNSLLWKQPPPNYKDYNKCVKKCCEKETNTNSDIILKCIRDICNK